MFKWIAVMLCTGLLTIALVPNSTTHAQTDTNCPTDTFYDVSQGSAGSRYDAPTLDIYCTQDDIVIQSNGITSYEFVQITPNDLQTQNYTWEIPLNPQLAEEITEIPLLGTVAVAINGLPYFGPNEAGNLGWGDPVLDEILDYCNGHTARQGTYHYHARPDCLWTDTGDNVGLVLGYALDGFPILAPYICTDESCSNIERVSSSWQRTQNVQAAWDAHEYVAGSGDLDQCNGMFLSDGSYAYFATDTFPYILGCYRGEVGETGMEPVGQPVAEWRWPTFSGRRKRTTAATG